MSHLQHPEWRVACHRSVRRGADDDQSPRDVGGWYFRAATGMEALSMASGAGLRMAADQTITVERWKEPYK